LKKPFTKKGWWSGSRHRPRVQASVPKNTIQEYNCNFEQAEGEIISEPKSKHMIEIESMK
jgi:hypothetical protein